MVMETPGPQEVGREFVRQYYTMLNEAPLHLHRFYSNNSAFVHGGVEKAGNEQPPVIGQEAIHKKILSLNFNDCHAKIRQVDSQATVEDSVVVQVTGELSNNGEPMRRFMQTFVLVPQTPKKFYVHNDIFRYQDEVFHDDDDADDSDRFITDPRQEIMENGPLNPEPAPPVSQEIQSSYYQQQPISNGNVEVEPLKPVAEPVAPQPVAPAPASITPEVDSTPSADSGVEEANSRDDAFEEKPQSKPQAPAPEPQQEFSDPAQPAKPVTWAALASKGTGAPPAFPSQPSSQAPKPSAPRSQPPPPQEPPAEPAPAQPPQQQRAPRAPRERGGFQDRSDRAPPVRTGDGEGDGDGNRRSNSVGGISSKYSDRQQLFVGNLPLNITERELKEFFEQYGKVEELRINTKSGGGKLPNFGFVVFESPDTVKKILQIKMTDGIKYNGEHRLNVEEKKARGGDGLRGRGGMSRGGLQGMSRGGFSSRGGMKNGSSGGFQRQDNRGSPNLGPRGGMQGRR